MKTVTFSEAKNNPSLVLEINVAFHDIEAKVYENNHPEIYSYEKVSWQELFTRIRNLSVGREKLTLLDIGTGTGFVPSTISGLLSKEDTVVFSDVSSRMLKLAERNTKNDAYLKKFVLIKNSYEEISVNSIDVITLNSVLHHIADIPLFFKEVFRMLKSGGVIIIKHEPNIRFGNNIVLSNLYKVLRFLRYRGSGYRHVKQSSIQIETIKCLEAKGITFLPPLKNGELQALVDIHSPTAAGSFDKSRGFNPFTFVPVYIDNAQIIECNTYGYLGKIRDDATFVRKCISKFLRLVFPKDGYFFDVVIKKM